MTIPVVPRERSRAQGPRVRVGFVGLGNMGAPMAEQVLAAGFELAVHDVRSEAARGLLAAGATWAESPAAAAVGADVVCLSLPGPLEMEAVVSGLDGVLKTLRAGAVLIDFTTNSPLLVRRLESEFRTRGIGLLDAPVSGGVTGARSRRLTVQVGGSAEDFVRGRPVLDAVADTVLHVGGSGAGNICKVLHNCAVFSANLATVECLTAGIKAGVEAATLIEVFQKSGLGRNHDLHVALPARLFRGNFAPHFALKTALKDMRLATELAQAVGVPMPLAERCESEMAEAVLRGWAERDDTIFLTLQEERAGVQVRLPAALAAEP